MSRDEQHGRRVRPVAAVSAVLLVLAGVVALVVGVSAQHHAPQPPASAASPAAGTRSAAPSGDADAPVPAPAPGSAAPATTDPAGPSSAAPSAAPSSTLPASDPVHLDAPSIGVHSDLLQLGLNPDNTVQVPPLAKDSKAGWYRYSPTPGEVGPSVILGHVDSAEYGAGVFFKLGALAPGATVSVTRADATVVTFRVDRVVRYAKDQFPTLDVYGNTPDPQLRLITCGGAFDPKARSYLDNIVVYASMVGSSAT
jgi:Sortase domain